MQAQSLLKSEAPSGSSRPLELQQSRLLPQEESQAAEGWAVSPGTGHPARAFSLSSYLIVGSGLELCEAARHSWSRLWCYNVGEYRQGPASCLDLTFMLRSSANIQTCSPVMGRSMQSLLCHYYNNGRPEALHEAACRLCWACYAVKEPHDVPK